VQKQGIDGTFFGQLTVRTRGISMASLSPAWLASGSTRDKRPYSDGVEPVEAVGSGASAVGSPARSTAVAEGLTDESIAVSAVGSIAGSAVGSNPGRHSDPRRQLAAKDQRTSIVRARSEARRIIRLRPNW
jgi:hypothetical protein